MLLVQGPHSESHWATLWLHSINLEKKKIHCQSLCVGRFHPEIQIFKLYSKSERLGQTRPTVPCSKCGWIAADPFRGGSAPQLSTTPPGSLPLAESSCHLQSHVCFYFFSPIAGLREKWNISSIRVSITSRQRRPSVSERMCCPCNDLYLLPGSW